MHTLEFSMSGQSARALDDLLRAVERGDVHAIRVHDGRLVVTLAGDAVKPPAPPRRLVAAR